LAYQEAKLDALGDATRRAILERLLTGPLPVGKLAQGFPVSRPAISQHLAILLKTRLVRVRQVGRERHYRLRPEPLERIRDWLALYERFWIGKLDALGEHLRKRRETRTQV